MPGMAILNYLLEDRRNRAIPLGIQYLMSAASREGHAVSFECLPAAIHPPIHALLRRDGQPAGKDFDRILRLPVLRDFLRRLAAANPNVIGFCAYEAYLNTLEFLIRLLRRVTDAYVLVGGPVPTSMGSDALRLLSADFAFLGEAEPFLGRFLAALAGARPSARSASSFAGAFAGLPSLAIRNVARPDGFHRPSFVPAARMEVFEQDYERILDDLDRSFETYRFTPNLNYGSSRGCPNRCVFCCSLHGKAFRSVSAGKIASDLIRIRDLAGRRWKPRDRFVIAFEDDNFLHDRDRVMAFFRTARAERLDRYFRFVFQSSVDRFFSDIRRDRIDRELLDAISRAGTNFITLGTDNFCDRELRTLGKPFYTKRSIYTLAAALEARGILNNHFCILTNLRTTAEDIEENLLAIMDLDRRFRRFVQMRPSVYLVPYYGTRAWREIREPSPRRERCLERRRLVFGAGKGPDLVLGNRLFPADPVARRIASALDRRVAVSREGPIAYDYDYPAALRIARHGRKIGVRP